MAFPLLFVPVASHGLPPPASFLVVIVSSCIIYLVLRRLLIPILQSLFSPDSKKSYALAATLDRAEKGTLAKKETLSDEDLFQLEKRAFFSKTWLFVCHRSRFAKAGDYLAFDVAGISFFVVLGTDLNLRAFHNVCRHRAYTVVRRPCGTSTRFSCKYHGWQYDDHGKLIKAPKFDESAGFVLAENGLFEIKVLLTQGGLVFVNFDASTMNLPSTNVKSHVDLGACSYLDGVSLTTSTNWRYIANEFSSQSQWSQTPFGWFSNRRNQKMVRLLGPLSMIKELDEDLWCTMTLLPSSASESVTRVDIYAKEGHSVSSATVEKWKWMLEKEIASMSKPDSEPASARGSFAYECGGRTIDLTAILVQHQRSEKMAKRKLQPTIRITGMTEVDDEASALCDAIDGAVDLPQLEACSKLSSFARKLEW